MGKSLSVNYNIVKNLVGKNILISYSSHVGLFSELTINVLAVEKHLNECFIKGKCVLTNEIKNISLKQISQLRFPNVNDDQLENVCKQYCIEKLKNDENKKIIYNNRIRNTFCLCVLLVIFSIGGCVFGLSNITSSSVSVSGYTRSDGTYVNPHKRRPPGSVREDYPFMLINIVSGISIIIFGASAVYFFKLRKNNI